MRVHASWRVSVALGASVLMSAGAQAQTAPPTPDGAAEEISSVFAFNRICYTQVPVIERIGSMAAQMAWKPLTGDELDEFRTARPDEAIFGWDARLGERIFRIGVTQGPASGVLTEMFPDFADGIATSCTMVLDGQDPADEIYAETLALAGKEPASANVPKDGVLTTTWAGGNADLKVFLVLQTNAQNTGNLLNVVVLTQAQ